MELAAVNEGDDVRKNRREGSLVRKIQSALAELGFYGGPTNGVLNPATETAIPMFQERTEMEVTGVPSLEWLDWLRFTGEVKQLQARLLEARETQITSARQALMRQGVTRDLVGKKSVAPADATRDSSGCIADPSVACLLEEAIESAKGIHQPQFRDWVLGGILVTQARAGFSDDALASLRLIEDPRLIIVGLRNIARAPAEAGRLAESRTLVQTIPLSWSPAETLATVATIELQTGATEAACVSVDAVLKLSTEATEPRRRIATLRVLASDLFASGDRVCASAVIDRAHAIARTASDDSRRESLLSEIAGALADIDRLSEATALF